MPKSISDKPSLRLPMSLKIMKFTKLNLLFTLLPIILMLTAAVGGLRRYRDLDQDPYLGRDFLEGGWRAIKDPTGDPLAKEMAEFAVSEYNKESPKTGLKFEKVISGENQVVAARNFRLVILASGGGGGGGGGSSRRYEAVVYWRAWEHYKNLTSFRPI